MDTGSAVCRAFVIMFISLIILSLLFGKRKTGEDGLTNEDIEAFRTCTEAKNCDTVLNHMHLEDWIYAYGFEAHCDENPFSNQKECTWVLDLAASQQWSFFLGCTNSLQPKEICVELEQDPVQQKCWNVNVSDFKSICFRQIKDAFPLKKYLHTRPLCKRDKEHDWAYVGGCEYSLCINDKFSKK